MFAEYIDLVQKKSYVINIDKTEKTSMDNINLVIHIVDRKSVV